MKSIINAMRFFALTLLIGLGLTACEEAETGGNVVITPPTATVTNDMKRVVTFSVNASTNWLLPLEWSVRDESLGRIIEAQSYSAIYESSGNGKIGNNTIVVMDQVRSEGVAVVQTVAWQEPEDEDEDQDQEDPDADTIGDISVTPTTVTLTNNIARTTIFIVEAGEGVVVPLTWDLDFARYGSITKITTYSARFKSSGTGVTGEALITVTDAEGSKGVAVVTLQ